MEDRKQQVEHHYHKDEGGNNFMSSLLVEMLLLIVVGVLAFTFGRNYSATGTQNEATLEINVPDQIET